MKNRGLIVLIAIMAIIGCLFFVSCGGDDDNNNNNNNNNNGGNNNNNNNNNNGGIPGLSTGTPNTNQLDVVGINETQFNAIKDAGGATNFNGWNYQEMNIEGFSGIVFAMVWSGRVRDNFNAVKTYLENNLSPITYEEENSEIIAVMGTDWMLALTLKEFINDLNGTTNPAGILQFSITKQN